MVTQEPVKGAIWHLLNAYCFTDAIFLAERLYAEVGNEESLYLLATCYHRAGHTKRAYNLLKKNSHSSVHNKFLFATVCYVVKKYIEAESALTSQQNQWKKVLQSLGTEYGSLAGVALKLLGNIYRDSDRMTKAGDCYKESLKYNPFLWGSFEGLCQIGEKIDPLDYFKTSTSSKHQSHSPYSFHTSDVHSPYQNSMQYISSENLDPAKAMPFLTSTVLSKPPSTNINSMQMQRDGSLELDMPPPKVLSKNSKARQRLIGSKASDSPLTPSFGVLPAESPIPSELGNSPLFITPPVLNVGTNNQLKAPIKVKGSRRAKETATKKSSFNLSTTSGIPSTTPHRESPMSDTENYIVPNLRRSSRLFGNQTKVAKRASRVHFNDDKTVHTVTRKSKSRIIKTNITQPLTPTTQNIIQASTKISQMNISKEEKLIKEENTTGPPSPIQQSANGLMKLLQEIGKAYHALSIYDSKKAISLFEDLPLHQQETCWVMEKIAISYFELGEMELAEQAFEKVREYDAYYIEEGMAIYSSLLWLLRKESTLACLAEDLTDCCKESAVAWCAMANCFSSQKEHDLAIKFLERAIQINPEFAYSYTLLGHEYVYNEELDRALSCFRTALRYNERHYNAWYGLGMIYYKQEKYQLAEQHYLKALKINPKHSVLLCHLAVAQGDLQKLETALETLNKASELNPKNALCKYQKSRLLIELDRVQEALVELKELKTLVPKDSNVYYLLGKAYQKLDEPHLAQMNFSWAITLDPQGANAMIKEAMNQQRYLNDDDNMLNEASTINYEQSELQQHSMQTEDDNDVAEDDDAAMSLDTSAAISF